MRAFFEKALRRDVTERFDNADEMLDAWRRVFTGVSQPRIERAEAETDADAAEAPDFGPMVALAKRETPLAQIGLSTRALNALERAHVLTAGDLVTLASRRLYAMAGVGAKTRAEIRAAKDALARKWAAEDAAPVTAPSSTSADDAAEVISIDLLMTRLLPRRTRSTDVGELRILNAIPHANAPTRCLTSRGRRKPRWRRR